MTRAHLVLSIALGLAAPANAQTSDSTSTPEARAPAEAAPEATTPETPDAAPAPVVVVAVPTAVPVDDSHPARDYAAGSVSVIGSASLGVGLVGDSKAGTAFQAVGITGGVSVRVVTHLGLALEPRLGVDGFLATGSSGLYALFAARIGLGAGWAFPIHKRLALTPMLSYELVYVGGGISSNLAGVAHAGAIELPLTVFFSRDAFVEVFLRGGVMGTQAGGVPIIAAGYRFGMVW